MKKILLVNCIYGSGSTGKILRDLHLGLLDKGWDSHVCYARGSAPHDSGIFKLGNDNIFKFQSFCSRLTGNAYGCSPISTRRLKHHINTFRPDIVNLHCINANTVNVVEILNFLKSKSIPTVVTCHAEFLYTGGCSHAQDCDKWLRGCRDCPQFKLPGNEFSKSWIYDKSAKYWKGLKNAYSGFDNIRLTCVSPWVKSRALQSPFFNQDAIFVTPNGVDTTIFHPYDSRLLKERHHIAHDTRVYVHVTPNFLSALKGGGFILEFAERLLKAHSNSKIIIIGFNGNEESLPENVIAIPRTSDQQELAMYYSLADVTLIASSRETFSMVTAESLCCGTPVVGFKAGGPESICTEGFASFVEYADMDAYTQEAISIGKDQENISTRYSSIFSKESMINSYIHVYRTFLNLNDIDENS